MAVSLGSLADSGERREFSTGAVRDMQIGKGRCDLMPLGIVSMLYDENPHIRDIFSRLDQFTRTGDPVYLRIAFETFVRSCDSTISEKLLYVSKHFEAGAQKYGEHNWQKGIPVTSYIDSATRHYLKYLAGYVDEPHDNAFVWNLLCCMWTCVNKPELNIYKKEEKND